MFVDPRTQKVMLIPEGGGESKAFFLADALEHVRSGRWKYEVGPIGKESKAPVESPTSVNPEDNQTETKKEGGQDGSTE